MRENGLPRTDIKLNLEKVVNDLGLSSSQYKGGDTVKLRFKLNLTNGKSYSNDGVTSSLTGSYFSSPFEYNLVIKCIPLSAVPGIYTFVMTDTPYEDGWQGSHIKLTVYGKTTNYGIPSDSSSNTNFNVTLESFSGNSAVGKATLTIPEGAKTMKIEWISGRYPEECNYTLEYTKLDGNSKQTAIKESNPSEGEKTLSICN